MPEPKHILDTVCSDLEGKRARSQRALLHTVQNNKAAAQTEQLFIAQRSLYFRIHRHLRIWVKFLGQFLPAGWRIVDFNSLLHVQCHLIPSLKQPFPAYCFCVCRYSIFEIFIMDSIYFCLFEPFPRNKCAHLEHLFGYFISNIPYKFNYSRYWCRSQENGLI